MAPPSARGCGGVPHRVLVVPLVLVVAVSLTGCIQEPDQSFQVRPGDLVMAHLVVANETTLALPLDVNASKAEELCGASLQEASTCPAAERVYSLGPAPADPPVGYEDPIPLPGPVANKLQGASPGETILLEGVQPWGPYRSNLVEEHPVHEAVPRIVDSEDAYGIAWPTKPLDEGMHKLMPDEEANGTRLSIDRWCNDRFCLFESVLTGYNATQLFVKHEPVQGARVHIDALDTSLAITNTTGDGFTVDGNHKHAGGTFDVFVHLTSARGPPGEAQRATGFQKAAVNGDTVTFAGLLGTPIVLEFFATWCPSCEENAKHLNRIEERFGDDVHIVSIGVDPWEEGASFERFIEENDVSWPVVVDGDGSLARAYGVGSLSTGVVINQEGLVVHTETGVADHERVVRVLEDLLEESTGVPDEEGIS